MASQRPHRHRSASAVLALRLDLGSALASLPFRMLSYQRNG